MSISKQESYFENPMMLRQCLRGGPSLVHAVEVPCWAVQAGTVCTPVQIEQHAFCWDVQVVTHSDL